jgi:hypothetical protein
VVKSARVRPTFSCDGDCREDRAAFHEFTAWVSTPSSWSPRPKKASLRFVVSSQASSPTREKHGRQLVALS